MVFLLQLGDALIWRKVRQSNQNVTAQCENTQPPSLAFSPNGATVATERYDV